MTDNNQDFIQVLLEKIEKDDLPTNVFDVEGTDPLVLLGKMNEIIGQLENFQSSVNTSNSTANEALSKAEDAVDTSGQALSNANTALGTANQAIGTANTAIETANQSLETAQEAEDIAGQALSNSNTALNTANTAIDTANTALGTANTALSTSQSANTTSSQALDTANNANATANSALESAGTANTTAETAKNIAETANQNSNQAVTTANEAKETAENALDTAENAETKANTAESIAQEALDQVVAGLGTKIYRGSQLLSSLDIKPIEDDIADNTTAITALQSGKVDKVTGKQLSTEDFTTAEKNKLAGLNNYNDTQVKADITDLQTADGQNVKISGQQDIDGSKNFLIMPQVSNSLIISSRSTANGYYVKYADGTLLCAGKIYSGLINGVKITFPRPFKQGSTRENIYVLTQMERDEGFSATYMNGQAIGSISATGFTVYAGYSETVYVNWYAIGRWK